MFDFNDRSALHDLLLILLLSSDCILLWLPAGTGAASTFGFHDPDSFFLNSVHEASNEFCLVYLVQHNPHLIESL
jgi:hypothetical protein